MRFLPDDTIRHLRGVTDLPDLSGTRYEIIDHVARGGMGVVYLARDRELDREVALKVLNTGDAGGDIAARLMKEARILARLEHPGMVPVHDVGVLPDGRVFYTMKFVRGSRLDEHARGERGDAGEDTAGADTGGADLTEMLRVFIRICEAVAFAHSHGVVHRDLKPANIMVGAFGEVLVLDWGVAKTLDAGAAVAPSTEGSGANAATAGRDTEGAAAAAGVDTRAGTVVGDGDTGAGAGADGGHTHPGTVMGTPGYMSPEQERGEVHRVDRRSDIYALGAILRGLVDQAAGDGVPKRIHAIAAKAMQPDPAQRYQTVDVLARDVTRFMAGMSVSAYEESALDRLRRFVHRHRVPIALVLAYLLMRILLFLFTRL